MFLGLFLSASVVMICGCLTNKLAPRLHARRIATGGTFRRLNRQGNPYLSSAQAQCGEA